MPELETVEVVNEAAKSGFTRINKVDFDPEIHVLYGDEIEPIGEKPKRGRPAKSVE